MTTPQADAPATPATRPPDRFEHEVREKGYLDEADVTESAICGGSAGRGASARPGPQTRIGSTRPPESRGRTCRRDPGSSSSVRSRFARGPRDGGGPGGGA
jgi:hypothetical protein